LGGGGAVEVLEGCEAVVEELEEGLKGRPVLELCGAEVERIVRDNLSALFNHLRHLASSHAADWAPRDLLALVTWLVTRPARLMSDLSLSRALLKEQQEQIEAPAGAVALLAWRYAEAEQQEQIKAPSGAVALLAWRYAEAEQQEQIEAPAGAVALLAWRYAEAVDGATRKLFQSLLDSHSGPQSGARLEIDTRGRARSHLPEDLFLIVEHQAEAAIGSGCSQLVRAVLGACNRNILWLQGQLLRQNGSNDDPPGLQDLLP
ncbi:hypothetical protein T484DRAFT_1843111, partial [Baffinella frigidus]